MKRPHAIKQKVFGAGLAVTVAGGVWGAIGANRTNYEVLRGESTERMLIAQGDSVPDELHSQVEDAKHDRGLYITLVEVSLGAIAYIAINRESGSLSTGSQSRVLGSSTPAIEGQI